MLSRVSRINQIVHSTIAAAGAMLLLCALPTLAAPPHSSPTPVGFNKDVRPILIETCFVCHGPDAGKRMAGFRIDQRDSAIARGVIVPGKPDKSKMIARINAAATSGIMPPASFNKPLTAKQKAILRTWIAQGAKYELHWAFVPPPAHVPIPSVKHAEWCRSPIDRFVIARLEQMGIKPSPDATREDWLRRVSLDLDGIQPTPAEIDTFVADRSPKCFETVVDRLLASPKYGERMASPWLDVARYADSYGYQSDQLSPTWPYRDWVVRAFNQNISNYKFVTYQIAGDLLPRATRDQRLATAFNRLHRMTNEGGSVPEEWRKEGVADRVRTFGTAFLGLTTECARCHDHKYDPITTRDYYSFASFFNNIDEYGLYDRSDIVPSPSLLLPTPDQSAKLAAAQQAVAAKDQDLAQATMHAEAGFTKWLESKPAPQLSDMTGQFNLDSFQGASLTNLVPGSKEQGARSDAVKLVPGHSGMAVLLDGENNINFPGLGRFSRSSPYTISFWMKDPREADGAAVVYSATDGTDAGPVGYDLMIDNGVLTTRMFRHWPGNAIAVRTAAIVPKDVWTHVAVTYDGSSRASGLKIYVNGKLPEQSILRDKMVKGIGVHTLVFGQRFRDRGFKGGAIDDLSIFSRDCTSIEVAQLFDGHALADAIAHPANNQNELRAYYDSAVAPGARTAASALEAARALIWQAEDPQIEVPVMDEMASIRPTFVLPRGRYDAPQNDSTRVTRTVPASLPPFPKGQPVNRLGLAAWLTSPTHPLTARVEVNRLWGIFFGKGIVETQEDFGIQGRPPTHPELLDWLARDFIDSGWDVKAMMRKIALSSVYRQESSLRPDLKERDPRNDLLARGPSGRLSAEEIRDCALAAAGLLDTKMGGPPVSPYQPGDLWRESNTMSPGYRQSVGGDLYRRSLYTVIKRTAPMPNMLAFDSVSREICTARRLPTNTPVQALVLLNDPQFIEAARQVAARAMATVPTESKDALAGRISYIFKLLASREPTRQELTALTDLYNNQKPGYSREPEMAAQLVHIGESKPDPTLPVVDLAALTVVSQTVLNLDATIWKKICPGYQATGTGGKYACQQ